VSVAPVDHEIVFDPLFGFGKTPPRLRRALTF